MWPDSGHTQPAELAWLPHLKRRVVGIADIIRECRCVIHIQVAKQNSPETLDTDLRVSAQPQGHTPGAQDTLLPVQSVPIRIFQCLSFPF